MTDWTYRSTQGCPNCTRQFYGNVKGEFCRECWRAWSRNDGTFEARAVSLKGQIAAQLATTS